MTITIENPEVEARIHAYATSRGLPIDKAIIAAIMNAEEAPDPPLNAEELERALRGKAQLEAGESLSMDEFLTQGATEIKRLFAEKEKREQEKAA
jgi:hypothetical protein